jgi:hypothetical protein
LNNPNARSLESRNPKHRKRFGAEIFSLDAEILFPFLARNQETPNGSAENNRLGGDQLRRNNGHQGDRAISKRGLD